MCVSGEWCPVVERSPSLNPLGDDLLIEVKPCLEYWVEREEDGILGSRPSSWEVSQLLKLKGR